MERISEGEEVSIISNKASELFALCDTENKGFITPRDMQRIRRIVSLEPAAIQDVFSLLDADNNGYLTLEEFAKGFRHVVEKGSEEDGDPFLIGEEGEEDGSLSPISEEDEEMNSSPPTFQSLLEEAGIRDFINDSDDALSQTWKELRKDPETVEKFEFLLKRLGAEVKSSMSEKESLESILKLRLESQDERFKQLVEEMEKQLSAQKKEIRDKQELKEKRIRTELETALKLKEEALQSLLASQECLKSQLKDFQTILPEVRDENDALAKEKKEMIQELERQRHKTQELEEAIKELRLQGKEERIKRAQAAFKVGETIANERESLIQELGYLRQISKDLRDEQDSQQQYNSLNSNAIYSDDDESQISSKSKQPDESSSLSPIARRESDNISIQEELAVANGDVSSSRDFSYTSTLTIFTKEHSSRPESVQQDDFEEVDIRSEDKYVPDSKSQKNVIGPHPPKRVFKVVFVGDTTVGKTTLINRFCTGHHYPNTISTVGVDYRTRNVLINDEESVCIQFWDTAGQERYRSITRQYFRKTDAVVVVYDISAEKSFLNVRSWLNDAREGAGEDAVIVLLGNKVDLAEYSRRVLRSDGLKLSNQFDTLFQEVSALNGQFLECAMLQMVKLLLQRQDYEIQKALRLSHFKDSKKNACCR